MKQDESLLYSYSFINRLSLHGMRDVQAAYSQRLNNIVVLPFGM